MKLEQAIKSSKFRNEVHKAGLNILYTAWWIKTLMSKELKEYGLTHEQYNVLRILKGRHPEQICVKEIACRIIEKSSNVPRIIDRLETKKLVKRTSSAADKRETVIVLTAAGINILDHSTHRVNNIMDATFLIEEKKAKALNDILEEIRKYEK
ncbi:MAG: MarR family transcriptional regulator [Parafilimonas sp.]